MCKKIKRATPPASASEYALPVPLITDSFDQSSSNLLMEDIIVAEILPRLHVKALFKFKCVSKQYESIISDPKFVRKYLQWAYSSPESSSSSGLLASLLFPFLDLSPFRDGFTEKVKDLSDAVDSSTGGHYPDNEDELSVCALTISLSCDHVNHHTLGSSGGLLLSLVPLESSEYRRFSLCVSNPLTKQCVQLPNSTATRRTDLMEFGFSTRWDHDAASLTYKAVIINFNLSLRNTIEVFSSDTGSWVAWEVKCPQVFYRDGTTDTCFSYKGILHWLDRVQGTVITYDPYDNPDQFGRIRLPEGKYSSLGCKRNKHKSLIYSGEEEMLKYCEIGKCESKSGVDRLMVWQLEDYDKGKWCLESELSVPSLLYACKRLMVAPYPWNRHVICHPYLRSKSITVINPHAGTRELVDMFSDSKGAKSLRHKCVSYWHKFWFFLAELCPWSSPFYALSAS